MKAGILSLMTAAVLVFAISSSSWAHDPIQQAQRNQIKRITGGVKDGKITHREYFRLKQEQNRIRLFRRQALADGRLTPGERRRLRQMQEKASEHIFRAKHNRMVRHSRYEHRPNDHRPGPGGCNVTVGRAYPGWGFSVAAGGKW